MGSWKKRQDECNEEYTTVVGGLISICINVIYYICVVYFAYLLFSHGRDSTYQSESIVNWEQLAADQNVSVNKAIK